MLSCANQRFYRENNGLVVTKVSSSAPIHVDTELVTRAARVTVQE